jgi:predicted peptidase
MATRRSRRDFLLPFAHGSREVPCWIHVPAGHEVAFGTRPLVLFLHGALERGRDGARVAEVGLPAHVRAHPRFPFLVVAPQCPRGATWRDLGDLLDALVLESAPLLRADPDRIHLTGISMGGAGAWWLAARTPGRFASVLPVCAPIPRDAGWPERAGRLRDLPVWAFLGQRDDAVPPEESRALVAALHAAGGMPRLTEYPDLGHRCWDRAYADPRVPAWWGRCRR